MPEQDFDDDERYLVISTDSHVGPPTEAFREYCPSAYLQEFDQVVESVRAYTGDDPERVFERVCQNLLGLSTIDPGLLREANRANLVAGQWDPDARRADMDADGVCGDVIFHRSRAGGGSGSWSSAACSSATRTSSWS